MEFPIDDTFRKHMREFAEWLVDHNFAETLRSELEEAMQRKDLELILSPQICDCKRTIEKKSEWLSLSFLLETRTKSFRITDCATTTNNFLEIKILGNSVFPPNHFSPGRHQS